MNIHFCVDMDGWVLQRVVESILPHLPGATYGLSMRTNADANIYFPYYLLRAKGPSLDIALFTHYEQDDSESSAKKRDAWELASTIADGCLAMSKQALAQLPAGSRIVEIAASTQFTKVPVFGVVGREYMSGRKRNDWVRGLPGEWIFSNGEVPWEKMPDFYRLCDYVVIASENEGGPMPVKEAIAMGKPVIAPNVGWAWDYPVIRYEGADGLRNVVLKLVPSDRTRNTARDIASAVHYLKNKEAA